jgi:hypothetical protein
MPAAVVHNSLPQGVNRVQMTACACHSRLATPVVKGIQKLRNASCQKKALPLANFLPISEAKT